jgi:hypothetical protein
LGGTLCKIGSPLLSFLLCSLCTPLQVFSKVSQFTTVSLMKFPDSLQSYIAP